MARIQRQGKGERPGVEFLGRKVGFSRARDEAVYELSHTTTIKIDPSSFEDERKNLETSVAALKELKAKFIAEINEKIGAILDEIEAARQEAAIAPPVGPNILTDEWQKKKRG